MTGILGTFHNYVNKQVVSCIGEIIYRMIEWKKVKEKLT